MSAGTFNPVILRLIHMPVGQIDPNYVPEDGQVILGKDNNDPTQTTSFKVGNSVTTYSSLQELLLQSPNGLTQDATINVNGFNFIIDDTVNQFGLAYADDFSFAGTTNPRWIPDWGTVTSLVTNSVSNGLYYNNNFIKLGGQLIESTSIDLNNNQFLISGGGIGSITLFAGVNLSSGPWAFIAQGEGYLNLYQGKAIFGSWNSTNSSSVITGITSDQVTGLFITDDNFHKGASYTANYSANNTSNPRWIIDKGYADATYTHVSSGITAITIASANGFTGSSSGGTTPALTLSLAGTTITAATLSGLSIAAGTVSSSDTILAAFGKIQGTINGLANGLVYKGVWNASTNSPTIISSTGTLGWFYKVGTAGTTTIDGNSNWTVGDIVLFDGGTWDKIEGNANDFISFNGRTTGTIVLTQADVNAVDATVLGTVTTGVWQGTAIGDTYISSSTNWNTAYTNRITIFTTSGSSGAATLSSNTLNIPNYTLAGLGGISSATVASTYVPYTGATTDLTLGSHNFSAAQGTFSDITQVNANVHVAGTTFAAFTTQATITSISGNTGQNVGGFFGITAPSGIANIDQIDAIIGAAYLNNGGTIGIIKGAELGYANFTNNTTATINYALELYTPIVGTGSSIGTHAYLHIMGGALTNITTAYSILSETNAPGVFNGPLTIGNTAFATTFTTSITLNGYNLQSGGSTNLGSYGYIALSANPNYTGTSIQYAITNAYGGNKFAIIYGNANGVTPTLTTAGALGTNTVLGMSFSGGVLNIPNLTASQAILTDASSNLISVGTSGTGNIVRVTSPTLVTPTLGAALATSINGNIFPAGTYTLTGAAGKTLTFNNTITLAGTDSTTMTFPSTSATIARTDAGNTFTGHQTIEGVTSTGATGTGNFVFSASPTFSGTVVLGTFTANGSGGNNIYIGTSNGVTHQTNAVFLFGGVSAVGTRTVISGTAATLSASDSYASLLIGPVPISTNTSGTSTWVTNLAVATPAITLTGGSTITNATTAYFGAAPTVGTNNYTAYFDTGTIGVTGNILPIANNTYNLGSTSVLWANVWGGTFKANFYTTTGGDLNFTVPGTTTNLLFSLNSTSTRIAEFFNTTGNLLLQNGGTFTDNTTDRLQISGTVISGIPGTTIGGYKLAGNTSGTISILPQAVAGTYNFNLPITAGTVGYLLTSQAGGSTAMTWTSNAGLLVWTEVVIATQTIVARQAYIATSTGGSQLVFTLPATAAVGDIFSIVGNGAGGWKIAQNASQIIKMSGTTTTAGTGGSMTSGTRYDAVEIICIVTNTTFAVRNSQGTLTLV